MGHARVIGIRRFNMVFSTAVIFIIVFFTGIYLVTIWLDSKGIDYPPPRYHEDRVYGKHRLQITLFLGEGEQAEIKVSDWFEYNSVVRAEKAKSDMEKALEFTSDVLSLRGYSIKTQGYTKILTWETISVEGGYDE